MSSHPDTDNEFSENSNDEDYSKDYSKDYSGEDEGPRTVTFKTFYWKFEDTDEGQIEINIAGRTADNKSVHCIVQNFTPFVYLELPKRIRWDKAKCMAVFNYFQKIMKSEGPLSMQLLRKYRLKYKKLVNTICMTFPTQKAAASIGSRCRNSRNGFSIDGVGFFKAGELIVHEINIDPILKLTASKKLKLASWVTIKETIRTEDQGLSTEDRKYSTADIDLYADWLDVEDWIPEGVIMVKPKYLSFDIECNSKNHNSKLPDPTIPENFIFSIAIICGYSGGGISKKILLSLFNPHDIKGTKVIRCKDEREILLKFRAFIEDENPDVIITYNGMKFDWGYMIARAELNRIYLKFAQNTRIIGKRAELMKSSWSSSAYGEQEFRYLDPMGRTNVDVLLEIERNYKLPKYNLDYVGEFFLKEGKEGVTPRQLFMLVQLTQEITPLVEDLPRGVVKKSQRIAIKTRIKEILPMRRCHGDVKKYRKVLMNIKTGGEFRDRIRDAMTITGTYNIQDTVLPVKLAEKLNLWTTMEEISNCKNVPMSYLHTRGQQVGVVAQVFRETIFNDLIIPYKERVKDEDKVRYEGAVVIEANPGDYDNVICTDFESLYPSMIIAYNICYTTLVEDTDPIADELCHVLTISSHIGCVHDKKKRKKKEKDILCHDRVYRFKKVIFHPDGTREGEGLMPKLERRLLSERKVKKKILAKLQATLKMAEGLAEDDDLAYYKKMGWEIIKKGSLDKKELEILKVSIAVVNAQQLALKVSANSMYGTLGAQNGPIPLVEGAETVTAMGRDLIIDAIAYMLKTWPGLKLVYGDTDSAMVAFIGKTTAESFELGDQLSKATTNYLKCRLMQISEDYEIECPSEGKSYGIGKYPRDKMEELSDDMKVMIYRYDGTPVNLQFENLYKRYLLLSKKRYVAHAVNRKGQIVAVINKGVVLARRDNCMYLRDSYRRMKDGILERLSQKEIMYILYDQIEKLFTRQIPSANLILYTGVKTIMNYAKKKEIKVGNRGVVEKVFLDEDKEPITDPIGPLDPRLVYPNLPQVLLSLKMLRRGDDVPPNTRLEYIYLRKDGAVHQGEKAEDYTFYKENKDIYDFKPDYLHYIEKQLSKPVTEILNVKYPPQKIPYEKLENHLDRLIEGLNELLKHRVKDIKFFEKTAKHRHEESCKVGWNVYGTARSKNNSSTIKVAVGCKKCSTKKKCSAHRSRELYKTYLYKKKTAQVEYILDSMNIKRKDPKAPNQICSLKYPELYQIALRWKSRNIIDRLYAQHGLRKRPAKRATQTGEKLRVKTKDEFVSVFLTKKVSKYPIGTFVKLNAIEEHTYENSAKKKKYYTYDIEAPCGKIIKNVSRESFTTWYYKDGSLMKDILLARGNYMCVVEELDEIFCPVIFADAGPRQPKTFTIIDEDSE